MPIAVIGNSSGAVNPYALIVKPSGSDDTASIKAAVNLAVANAQSRGDNYAEVWFTPGIYLCQSATTKGGSTKGNAQIPLPIIDPTVSKVTLALRCTADSTAAPHWNQTHPLRTGAVFYTSITGTNDSTYGEASVIGGPTPAQGYGYAGGAALFNNMLIVIDGLCIISSTTNPTMSGFDFRGMAEAHVISGSAFTDSYPSIVQTISITNQWTFGLAMPQNDNNDNCTIDNWSCQGYCFGMIPSEHTDCKSARLVYCVVALALAGLTYHGMHFKYVSAEWCQSVLSMWNTGAASTKIQADLIDVEDATSGPFIPFQHVNDPNNFMTGKIHFVSNNGTSQTYLISGATNLEIINTDTRVGNEGNLTPASNSPQKNTTGRPCALTVSGGTVSAISVDGSSIGITSGTFILPANRSFTITYTVAPTIHWVSF